MKKVYLFIVFFVSILGVFAQVETTSNFTVDYISPKEFEIGRITVSGVKYINVEVVKNLTGLAVGEKLKVPGEKFTKAVKQLWAQGLFSDVKVKVTKQLGSIIYIEFELKERKRLSTFSFNGISKSNADDLKDMLRLAHGKQVTQNIINTSKKAIKDFFIEKGFLFCDVRVDIKDDSKIPNQVSLLFDIKKGEKVKVDSIIVSGNHVLKEVKIRRAMKNTKVKHIYRIFKTSKYIKKDFEDDLQSIVDKYNEDGYRDAQVASDTIIKVNDKQIKILLTVHEGKQYFFRDIKWQGKTKYSSDYLSQLLGIKKGEVYDKKRLNENLFMNPAGVFSLYQDNGYLFSSVTPIETAVNGDSIDLLIQVYEGKIARINEVTVTGNTKTNDHVIIREIKTLPGDLYSRSKIMRTNRELATLGYFNPEKLNVIPTPHPEDGTVDLQYVVEEKPSDQIELSGGWGAGMIVGTLGVSFNNFSIRNFFNKKAWQPLPSGDGQRLSLRAQSNGTWYQSYSFSFMEPWLGGHKPNSLSVSLYHTVYSNGVLITDPGRQTMKIYGSSVGLGRRLKWPDDFFTLYNDISYQRYVLNNYSFQQMFQFTDGTANNLSFSTILSRNSQDQLIFPRRGSNLSVSLQLTPPYSALGPKKDYTQLSDQELYKWIEYHKWKFKSEWFTKLAEKMVLYSRGEFGFKGFYNKQIGHAPFEGFNLGGDGLMAYNLYGMETIALRGYTNGSLTPTNGGNMYDKFTMELRYLLSPNPNATFYVLGFLEGGNAWNTMENYNPFNLHRSAGVGVRIFLPMFGKLGVDWGYGFDAIPGNPGASGSQFHFIIGQNI
jgi:outer membrane protein insertion porin family